MWRRCHLASSEDGRTERGARLGSSACTGAQAALHSGPFGPQFADEDHEAQDLPKVTRSQRAEGAQGGQGSGCLLDQCLACPPHCPLLTPFTPCPCFRTLPLIPGLGLCTCSSHCPCSSGMLIPSNPSALGSVQRCLLAEGPLTAVPPPLSRLFSSKHSPPSEVTLLLSVSPSPEMGHSNGDHTCLHCGSPEPGTGAGTGSMNEQIRVFPLCAQSHTRCRTSAITQSPPNHQRLHNYWGAWG